MSARRARVTGASSGIGAATAKLAAQKEAREAAVDAAFVDVDIWELQKAWMEFVAQIPDPKERR